MSAEVAFLVPCHRAEATLPAAVRSALEQEAVGLEVVLAPDDGIDYLALLAAQGIVDPRLTQAAPGPVCSGPSAARNRALAMTAAPYVAPLDADDRLAPGYAAALLAAATRDGAAAARLHARLGDGREIVSPGPLDDLTWRDIVDADVPIFFMSRRDLLGRGWPEKLRFSEDMVVNLKLRARLRRYGVAEGASYLYAIGTNSLTTGANADLEAERHYRLILAQLDQGRMEIPRAERACVRALIEAKRQRNAAYERAHRDGYEGSFYDFRL